MVVLNKQDKDIHFMLKEVTQDTVTKVHCPARSILRRTISFQKDLRMYQDFIGIQHSIL